MYDTNNNVQHSDHGIIIHIISFDIKVTMIPLNYLQYPSSIAISSFQSLYRRMLKSFCIIKKIIPKYSIAWSFDEILEYRFGWKLFCASIKVVSLLFLVKGQLLLWNVIFKGSFQIEAATNLSHWCCQIWLCQYTNVASQCWHLHLEFNNTIWA